jgi:uncharacterized protein (DUF58 family)
VTPDALAAGAAATYDGLGLHVRGATGDRLGEHRMAGRPQASGLEVESYRPYAHGDDLRHLDWSALARLDVLVTRRFTAEREQPVHLLVDASASMGTPARDDKLGVARELAMALGWMALATHDPVRVARLGTALGPSVRRPADARRVAAQLCALASEGAVELGDALAAHAARHREPATVVVVSDCMAEPAAIDGGLGALRARRHTVVLLQVLGAGELDPARDFTHGVLADVESGATHPIALTPEVRRRYDALLAEHLGAVEAAARRHGVPYARLVTGTPVPDFVTGPLARLGLVRRR